MSNSQVIDVYPAPYGKKNGEACIANPTQLRVLDWVNNIRNTPPDSIDHIPILYVQGGVGCGKTRSFMAPVVEMLTEIHGIRILWGRQDFKDLKLSIMDKFFEIIPPEVIQRRNEQYSWYDISTEGEISPPARIYFNGLKDLTGLGSQEFAVIVINEVHEITEQIYRALKRRCRQEGMPIMILMEGEAPNDNHWLANLTNPSHESYDPDIEMWTISTYENWDNLPLAYRGSLETMPESWKMKYLMGKFGFQPAGKPYYSGYKEIIHAHELEWIPDRDLICGWDFGYHHPACLITQIDFQDRWCWLREIIGTDTTIDKFADKVKQEINLYYPNSNCIHFGDPACIQKNDKSEFTSWQILASKGINIHYKTSEYRLRKEIIEHKLSLLVAGKPSLIVDRRYCKIANDGFLGGYHYPEMKPGQQINQKFEQPFKDGFYEHVMNSGEYIAVNMFSPIVSRRSPKKKKKFSSISSV